MTVRRARRIIADYQRIIHKAENTLRRLAARLEAPWIY